MRRYFPSAWINCQVVLRPLPSIRAPMWWWTSHCSRRWLPCSNFGVRLRRCANAQPCTPRRYCASTWAQKSPPPPCLSKPSVLPSGYATWANGRHRCCRGSRLIRKAGLRPWWQVCGWVVWSYPWTLQRWSGHWATCKRHWRRVKARSPLPTKPWQLPQPTSQRCSSCTTS